VADQSALAIKLGEAVRSAFADRLAAMTPQERFDLADRARRDRRWRPPDWLQTHALKHGHGRTPRQYEEWAQLIKNRSRTQVYAMVHPLYRTEGLAFIDPIKRSLVWYDLSGGYNVSCFDLDETIQHFLAKKGIWYWRLPDAELA
jgi:hypothetical protein